MGWLIKKLHNPTRFFRLCDLFLIITISFKQEDPEPTTEIAPGGGGNVIIEGVKDPSVFAFPRTNYSEDFAALESGEWRLPSSAAECLPGEGSLSVCLDQIQGVSTCVTGDNAAPSTHSKYQINLLSTLY